MDTIDTPSSATKRPRPVVSCLQCRQKKLKCDRNLPCSKCTTGGREEACVYASGQAPSRAGSPVGRQNGLKRPYEDDFEASGALADLNVKYEALHSRVLQLQRAFEARQHVSDTSVSLATSCLSPNVSSYPERPVSKVTATTTVASRIMNMETFDKFEAAREFVSRISSRPSRSEIARIGRQVRALDTGLKNSMRLAASFRIYHNTEAFLEHMIGLMPSASVCNILIEHYFNYFENCTRVLHRPTTKAMFRAYFNGSLLPERKAVCLPLLLGVVSIASSLGTFNECENPAIHGQHDGIGAYHLLRGYLDTISDRTWLALSTLQVAALTLKYHKSCTMSDSEKWQWSGQVLRRAVAAGIHKTSEHGHDYLDFEIRRRLWLTLLETDLTCAIASKMPPNCLTWSGDLPANVNDGQLYPNMQERPGYVSEETWTDGTCQHILAQSFNARLSAYSAVVIAPMQSYETILQHTRYLEQIIHDLPRLFRFEPGSDEASDTPHRLMARMEMDFLLRRPLNACYAPFGSQMPEDDRYREARIPWIQGCTFSICFQDLFDPRYPTMDLPEPRGLWDYFHNVYVWDMEQFLLATCLELQRIRKMSSETTGAPSPAFENQALRTRVRVMGWNANALIKSLEDTIGPLTRRVGRYGSCFRDVVRWTTVFGSLRDSPPRSAADSIVAELQDLVVVLQKHLQLEDDPLGSAINDEEEHTNWLESYLLGADDAEQEIC